MTSTRTPAANASMSSDDVAATADVAAFLFHEGQLLDDFDLEAWLDLFEPDAQYTIPMGPKDGGTHLRVALVCDDRARLEERVMRITSGASYAQNPRSMTMHQIGNVSIVDRAGDEVDVRSMQVIVELRHGLQRTFAAECRHRLRHTEHGYRIVAKTTYLLNRDEPLGDLTFII